MSDEKPVWTLDSALALVRGLAPGLENAGWSLALGGSVLKKGGILQGYRPRRIPPTTLRKSPALTSTAPFRLKGGCVSVTEWWYPERGPRTSSTTGVNHLFGSIPSMSRSGMTPKVDVLTCSS